MTVRQLCNLLVFQQHDRPRGSTDRPTCFEASDPEISLLQASPFGLTKQLMPIAHATRALALPYSGGGSGLSHHKRARRTMTERWLASGFEAEERQDTVKGRLGVGGVVAGGRGGEGAVECECWGEGE